MCRASLTFLCGMIILYQWAVCPYLVKSVLIHRTSLSLCVERLCCVRRCTPSARANFNDSIATVPLWRFHSYSTLSSTPLVSCSLNKVAVWLCETTTPLLPFIYSTNTVNGFHIYLWHYSVYAFDLSKGRPNQLRQTNVRLISSYEFLYKDDILCRMHQMFHTSITYTCQLLFAQAHT